MIVFTMLLTLNTLLGYIGNLLVLLVVILYREFQNMRYFLLASLAFSDWIFAALVASSRTAANAAEKWIFGTTGCHGAAFITRVLHHSTCFHLCAVSHERYDAIVRRPLNYSGRITKNRAFLIMILLWILPVLISLAPFFGFGDFVYNPDIYACEQKWDRQTGNSHINRHISCATWGDLHSELPSAKSCPSASAQCRDNQSRRFQPRERGNEFKNAGSSEQTAMLQR